MYRHSAFFGRFAPTTVFSSCVSGEACRLSSPYPVKNLPHSSHSPVAAKIRNSAPPSFSTGAAGHQPA